MAKYKAAGLLGKLAVGAGALIGSLGDTNAGIIKVMNNTPNTSVGVTNLYCENKSGATEGYDGLYDSTFLSSPDSNILEIYTKLDGSSGKLSTDARPINTSGWDIYLRVKGSVTNLPNSIKFKPTYMEDLTEKILTAYDYAHPETVYTINNTLNAITTIPLPNLTASNKEYARWRLDVNEIPEPSALGLLGAGAAGLGIAGYLGKRRNRGKELRAGNRRANRI